MAAVEEEVVSTVELGRAIHLLRNDWRYKNGKTASWGYRRPSKIKSSRRFTDEQIQVILGVNHATMLRCLSDYGATLRSWSIASICDAVVSFSMAEGRWPNRRDFDSDDRLPASSTYYSSGGQTVLNAWLQTKKNARSLTPVLLLGLKNVTVRQQAIESYGGISKLIRKGGATKVASDEWGTLWRMPDMGSRDKTAMWLEVVNATENNGRREHFFLRVPPGMVNPKTAVEWTFDIEGQLEEFAAAS